MSVVEEEPDIADRWIAYEFSFTTPKGEPFPLADYRGRPMLIVNTASRCGFARQFMGLQSLWERYRDEGLLVVGVPTGDFANQEFETGAEALEFCEGQYNVDFPIMEKTSVCGPDAHPFYQWANHLAGTLGWPRWNFHKYLIGADGRFKRWYPTVIGPTSKRIRAGIESELAA